MCTSIIISGKKTADGRPLLLKHRDQRFEDNRVEVQTGKLYKSINLVNSNHKTKTKSWCGTNDVGFSIISTASYNLGKRNIKGLSSPTIINKALSVCKNMADFENLLSEQISPMIPTNYGIIDAEGGAAYFEVHNYSWVKYDVNDHKVAPNGYLVYTNFSRSGKSFHELPGKTRFDTTNYIIEQAIGKKNITPKWIFNEISRSFYNKRNDSDLKEFKKSKELLDQDYVPNSISVASVVFQGVKPNENPANTIMWTILGYAPVGIAIPLFVTQPLPHFVQSFSPNYTNALLCDYTIQLKKRVLAKLSGSKVRLSYSYLFGINGVMQEIEKLENELFQTFLPLIDIWRKSSIRTNQLEAFYSEIWNKIDLLYQKLKHKHNIITENDFHTIDTEDVDKILVSNKVRRYSFCYQSKWLLSVAWRRITLGLNRIYLMNVSKYIYHIVLTFILIISSHSLFACTGIIVTGKATKNGRPLLLKQRDSKHMNVAIKKYTDSKYTYISLINSELRHKHSLCGTNEAGLAIINSATYNLGKRIFDKSQTSPSEIMTFALGSCKTIEEFDEMLLRFSKPFVPTNIAIIDAYGGAAYYEFASSYWKKYDINDSIIAPRGYFVFSNYSLIGKSNNKYGIERQQTAELVLSKVNPTQRVDAQWIFNNICRLDKTKTLELGLLQNTYDNPEKLPTNYFIANEQTNASVLFQGVKPNEKPTNSIMYTLLGYPLTGVVVPLLVNQFIPNYIKLNKTRAQSKLLFYSWALKSKSFENNLEDNNDTIISKCLNLVESEMFSKMNKCLVYCDQDYIDKINLSKFYNNYFITISTIYQN